MEITMAEKRTKYKLVRGKHHGFDEDGKRKTYQAGDWLMLTDEQARAFRGKIKSEAQLKAEANVEELDKALYATSEMTPTRDQPLAPLEPTEEDSNKLADPNASEAMEKQTNLNTDQGDGKDATQKDPAKPAADPAKASEPAKK
jgi:hypothetical protein